MVGEEAEQVGDGAGEVGGGGGGGGGGGEDVLEVAVVGEEVVAYLGLDVEGADLEAVDEEAEIGGGEWGGGVEVVGGQEVSDVDGAEQHVHPRCCLGEVNYLILLLLLQRPVKKRRGRKRRR